MQWACDIVMTKSKSFILADFIAADIENAYYIYYIRIPTLYDTHIQRNFQPGPGPSQNSLFIIGPKVRNFAVPVFECHTLLYIIFPETAKL